MGQIWQDMQVFNQSRTIPAKIVANLVTKLIKFVTCLLLCFLFFGCWMVYWLPRDKDEVILIVWVG